MEIEGLSQQDIIRNMQRGRDTTRNRFFHTEARAQFSWAKEASLGLMSRQLANLRKACDFFLR